MSVTPHESASLLYFVEGLAANYHEDREAQQRPTARHERFAL
jgi:hypothetical protein